MFSVRYTLKQQQLYAFTSGQLDVLLLHGRDAFVCMATGMGGGSGFRRSFYKIGRLRTLTKVPFLALKCQLQLK